MLTITTFQEIPTDVKNDIDLLYTIASWKNINYTNKRLQEPTIATTVVYENDILVGVSSILMRSIYNIPRIMNRYYYNDGSKGLVPKHWTGKIRKTFVDMFDQQADLAFKLGYTGVFTSRETNKAFPRLCKGLNEYSKYEWNTDDSLHQVTYSDAAKQYIIWAGDKYEYTRSI